MRIKYLPSSPKFGITEHVPTAVGATLVAAGFAEAVPYSDFRERLAAEAMPASITPVVEWGVKDSNGTAFSQPTIIKKVGCETFYLKEPDETTPPAIVEKFHALKNTEPGAARTALEAAKRQQEDRERAERTRVRSLVIAGK